MVIYVSKDFFLKLSRKYSIKMSCNIQTKYLQFLKTIRSHRQASHNPISHCIGINCIIHFKINLICFNGIHWMNLNKLYQQAQFSIVFLPLNDLVWYYPTNYLSQNPYKWKFFVLGMTFLVRYYKKTLLMYSL